MPVADGGDLTGRILCEAFGAEIRTVATVNSMGDPIESNWGYVAVSKTAILELADSSGNRLIERSKLNPMLHTTYGTGLVAKAALDMGCTRIIMGVGGSATVDGGQGFLQALGV
jgi:glycerate kinase